MGSGPSRPAPTECGLSLSPDCFMWNGKGWKGPAPSQPAPTECGLKTCLPCSSSEACLPCKSGKTIDFFFSSVLVGIIVNF